MRLALSSLLSPAALAALAAAPALAQGADGLTAEHDARPPHVAYGTTAGAMSWADGHGEEALGGLLQLQPREWLVLSANPGFVRATDSTGLGARSGLADLPLGAGVEHAFAKARWHPSAGVSGIVSLPTGDASAGLGAGRTTLSAEAALGIEPVDGLDLRLGAWHGLSSAAGSGVGQGGSSLSGEASYGVLDRLEATLLYDAELGAGGDSTYAPARIVGGGLAFALAGPLTLTMQGTHAVAGDGPRWALSVGVGTAFAGLSPIGATSPLSRVRGAFSHGVKHGTASGVGGACHKGGGC